MIEPVAVRLKRLYSELSVDNQIVIGAAVGNKFNCCAEATATHATSRCGAAQSTESSGAN
jgi:hypothetical protein